MGCDLSTPAGNAGRNDSGLKRSLYWAGSVIPDKANRERDDFYPTPPCAVKALLAREKFDGPIWEPACGDGAISKVLESAGYTVISTDLVARGYGEARVDFLMEHKALAPNIITNPPFKYCLPFARRALDLADSKVALLCRLAWLEGVERREFFESTPLARVLIFSRRLDIRRNGWVPNKGNRGMIAFAWFVWDHSYVGKPTLGWL